MRGSWFKKGLVVGIIILFIGVGVQPAFANESVTKIVESENDCYECQVSDGYSRLRAKILLFRVKVVTNVILSLKIDDIPEINKDCKEILDVIYSDKPLSGSLICDALAPLVAIAEVMSRFFPLAVIGMTIQAILHPIGYMLDCDWYPP